MDKLDVWTKDSPSGIIFGHEDMGCFCNTKQRKECDEKKLCMIHWDGVIWFDSVEEAADDYEECLPYEIEIRKKDAKNS